MADEKKEPVIAFSPDDWSKLSPEEKQRFCDEYNKSMAEKRAAAGLPPLDTK